MLLNNGGKPVSQTFGNVPKMLVRSQATGLAGSRAGATRDLGHACLSSANAATFSVEQTVNISPATLNDNMLIRGEPGPILPLAHYK